VCLQATLCRAQMIYWLKYTISSCVLAMNCLSMYMLSAYVCLGVKVCAFTSVGPLESATVTTLFARAYIHTLYTRVHTHTHPLTLHTHIHLHTHTHAHTHPLTLSTRKKLLPTHIHTHTQFLTRTWPTATKRILCCSSTTSKWTLFSSRCCNMLQCTAACCSIGVSCPCGHYNTCQLPQKWIPPSRRYV